MNRRRRYTPDWPEDLPARRKRMSRIFLFVAIGLAATAFVTAVQRRSTPEAVPTATATTVTRPSTTPPVAEIAPATAASGTATVTLERRDDGWYLPGAATWPLVTVGRVIDGDTLDVVASGVTLRVRVFGIDTPERGEACFTEATRRLETLAGREVRLVPDRRLQDAYQRELRYVFTPAGRSIDAALLDEGYARAWTQDGALRTALVPIAAAAQAAHRGCLWGG
jgi:endonuclease YncB( thermonuclease family)